MAEIMAAAALAGGGAQDAPRVWVEDCLTKVVRGASWKSSPSRILSLEGARGETVSGQIVVQSPVALTGAVAKADVPGLPAGAVRLQWVRYIDVRRNSPGVPLDELVAPAPCSLPDPFWDRDRIDVPAGEPQPLWVEVDIPRDATPGRREGRITLSWQGGGASVPFRLRVRSFEMPQTRHQQVTNWFDFPGAGFSAEPGSDAYFALARQFARIMRAHRQTCFATPLWRVATTYEEGKGFVCDFTFLDRWADAFFGEGLERMELFQAGAWTASVDDLSARVVPADLPVTVKTPGVQLTREQKLRGVLGELDKHIRAKGWQGKVMLHIADEPFLHGVPSYRQLAALVREAAPSVRIVEAIEATGFGDSLDVMVPKLSHLNLWYHHFRDMHRDGRELWFYTCCHPVGRYPNRFLDQPLVKTRVLHWVGYLYGLDGYLHWGLNYFAPGVDPYSEEGISKDLPLGDRAIMYPGKDGPVGSLRWSAMRDGLQDFEYLWMLEDALRKLKERVGPGAEWLDPRQRPTELCRRVAQSFLGHTRSGSTLLAARSAIADEIEALAAGPLLVVQTEPAEGAEVPAGPRHILVRGIAESGATVMVNDESVPDVRPDGAFGIRWFLGTKSIRVTATKDGRARTVERTFRLTD